MTLVNVHGRLGGKFNRDSSSGEPRELLENQRFNRRVGLIFGRREWNETINEDLGTSEANFDLKRRARNPSSQIFKRRADHLAINKDLSVAERNFNLKRRLHVDSGTN